MPKVESERISPGNTSPTGHANGVSVIDIDAFTDAKTKRNGYPRTATDKVAVAKSAFKSGKTKAIAFRRQQLKDLLRLIEENGPAFEDALAQDLGRHRQESAAFDIDYTKFEVQKTLARLNEWVAPEKPPVPLINALDKLRIYNDPYGVVLIMGAWNFPVNLIFAPLAGAIAAGNCVIIKPSELASATAKLIAELVPRYLDKECYQVYVGGVLETAELLEERFDYIFFTGSTAVGKIVHAAANKYLTPVTLELGGKSATYLDKSADMEIAVRRILWGKCSNAGQVCIAPDYILCTKEVQERFISIAAKVLKEWYGNDVKANPCYSRIITDNHYNRLISFLRDKRNIAVGGQTDAAQRFIEPTILVDVNPNDPVMQEEIFGPILPIITIETPQEAISFINAREKPLALYIFSNDKKIRELFLNNTSSGGVGINDTVMHFAVDTLPFGGVGFSGMGAYHGKSGFDTFVHKKGVMERTLHPLPEKLLSLRYPPYNDRKINLVSKLMRPWGEIPYRCFSNCGIFLLGAAFVIIIQVIYCLVTGNRMF